MELFQFDRYFLEMMESNHLRDVVILAHMNPDGDAAGCVMGLAHYIKAVYQQYNVYPFLSDRLDKGPKKLVMDDYLFRPFEREEVERYAVIVCDTASLQRMIGIDYYENAVASLVIDHHASNEGYGDVNHTLISESCSENIYHSLDKKKLQFAANKPHPNVADYLYLGILHDTGGFKRANTGILQAGADLIKIGAEHDYVMRTMNAQSLEDLIKRSQILNMIQREFEGKVAYIYVDEKLKEKYGISYEDIHPISGIMRDCEDVKLGFTMYEEESNLWRCSFRSEKTWINVNELLGPFGGGGHAAAAGLRLRTDDPLKLKEDILQAINESRAQVTEETIYCQACGVDHAKEMIDHILKGYGEDCQVAFRRVDVEISNSYKVTSKEDRLRICKMIAQTGVTARSHENLSAEWEVHNAAWHAHVGRSHARDVSLDYSQDPRASVRFATEVFEKLKLE